MSQELQAKIQKLEERLDALTAIVDSRLDANDEDLNSLTERVRDLENQTNDGFSVEDYG